MPITKHSVRMLAGVLVVGAGLGAPQQLAIDRLPRPMARTPAADKIAAALAQKDAQFQRDAEDCRAQAKESKVDGFDFRVGARRLLETATLYSVEVVKDWYCGGAYPAKNATALTFDFRSGMPYDLNRAFRVGKGHLAAAALPVVLKHRQDTLRRTKDTGDCGQIALDEVMSILRDAELSLGVTSRYVIFYFDVPHAVAACFPPVQVPFAELLSFADRTELQRLGPPLTPE